MLLKFFKNLRRLFMTPYDLWRAKSTLCPLCVAVINSPLLIPCGRCIWDLNLTASILLLLLELSLWNAQLDSRFAHDGLDKAHVIAYLWLGFAMKDALLLPGWLRFYVVSCYLVKFLCNIHIYVCKSYALSRLVATYILSLTVLLSGSLKLGCG